MIGRRRRADEDADEEPGPSPWATGDVVHEPAPEFEWPSDESPSDDGPEPGSGDPDSRRTTILAALACSLALVVAAVVLWPRSDDRDDDADPVEDDAPEATLDTLPDAERDEDDSTDDPAGTDAVTTTTDGGALSRAPAATSGDLPDRIELPPVVAAISEPTEIVMTGGTGIVTLSLPSGRVRWTTTERPPIGGLIVAPDAAAYVGQGDIVIVPRTGLAVSTDVELDGVDPNSTSVYGWREGEDGSTRFIGQAFGGPGDEQRFLVDLGGRVERYDPPRDSFADSYVYYGGIPSTGDDIVNDAGGTYVIAPDGTVERISTGDALAVTDRFAFVRECDESLTCGFVVIDRESGERRPTPVTSEQFHASWGSDLSPDGTAVSVLDSGDGGRRIIDLTDGRVLGRLTSGGWYDSGTAWAADGSGVFSVGPTSSGLTFLDRASGEVVEFGEQLGNVQQFGIRFPESELEPDAIEASTRSAPLTFSAPPSEGLDLDLVVMGDLDSMAYLDLAAAEATVWATPGIGGRNGPDLIAAGDAVLALASNGRDGFVSRFGSASPIDTDVVTIPPAPRFPGPSPRTLWAARDDAADGVDHARYVVDELDMAPVDDSEIVVPDGEVLGGDPWGSLMVTVAGDVYAVRSSDELARLTTGDLLAIGRDHAIVRECDASLSCGVRRIAHPDGATPDADPVELSDVLGDLAPTAIGAGELLADSVSPDGSLAVLRADGLVVNERGGTSEGVEASLLVDVDAGGVQLIPAPVTGQPLVWSDDFSAFVYLADDGLHVYDRVADQILTVDGLGRVEAITRATAEFVTRERSGPSDPAGDGARATPSTDPSSTEPDAIPSPATTAPSTEPPATEPVASEPAATASPTTTG